MERGITRRRYGSPRWTGPDRARPVRQPADGAARVRDHGGVGTWLPWVVLVLLVGGVAVANRRPPGPAVGGRRLRAGDGLAGHDVRGRSDRPGRRRAGQCAARFGEHACSTTRSPPRCRSTAVAAVVLGLAVVAGGLAGGTVPGTDQAREGSTGTGSGSCGRRPRAADSAPGGRRLGASVSVPAAGSDRGAGAAAAGAGGEVQLTLYPDRTGGRHQRAAALRRRGGDRDGPVRRRAGRAPGGQRPGRARYRRDGPGWGRLGMLRRVATLGGGLVAGPTPGGGYRVLVTLPDPGCG